MDVSCPKCQTLFELEPSQLQAGNATLQCSECEHVFRIRSAVENTKRWMLRNQAGDISYFTTFDVLHQWMMEQKVSQHDEISRSGNKWVTLESVGEFAPVFQVLESIKDLLPKSPDKDPVFEAPPEIRTQKASRPRIQTEQQFVNFAEIEHTREEDDDFIFGREVAPTPPPHSRREPTASVRMPKSVDSTSSLELPWEMSQEIGIPQSPAPAKKSSVLKPLFLLLFLAAFIGGIGYLFNMKRKTPPITLGSDKAPVLSAENISETNTRVHSALSQAKEATQQKDKGEWDQRFAETKIPLYNALTKATSKAKKKGGAGNIDSMLEKGLKALESGNLAVARGSFIHVLDAQPGNSEAITGLGWVKLEGGNASGAVREFRRALSLNPNYRQAYMGLGQALRENGQSKAALEAYTKYLKKFPSGSRAGIARYQQGELRRKLGLDKAEEVEKVEEEKAPLVEEKKAILEEEKPEKTTEELPEKTDTLAEKEKESSPPEEKDDSPKAEDKEKTETKKEDKSPEAPKEPVD